MGALRNWIMNNGFSSFTTDSMLLHIGCMNGVQER